MQQHRKKIGRRKGYCENKAAFKDYYCWISVRIFGGAIYIIFECKQMIAVIVSAVIFFNQADIYVYDNLIGSTL